MIEPATYADDRGFFLETFQAKRYRTHGIREDFQQDNHSRSNKNVLHGLHFTRRRPQSQIVTVMRGRIFDVVVDMRPDSPTFREWFGAELSDDGVRQLYIPHGFAHRFCVLSDFVDLHYKVSQLYDPSDEHGIIWNDPDLGIRWPLQHLIVSARDRNFPRLADL